MILFREIFGEVHSLGFIRLHERLAGQLELPCWISRMLGVDVRGNSNA
jgi:hypothetical protein